MKALTKEWIRKAEEDYRVCRRELQVRRGASLDVVCFHAQQCAEKYLKAVLQESGISFPKTHDLEALVNLVTPVYSQFNAQRADAKRLASHAVEVRYPGCWSVRSDAEDAFQTARAVRVLARNVLGLVRRPVPKKPRRAGRKKRL